MPGLKSQSGLDTDHWAVIAGNTTPEGQLLVIHVDGRGRSSYLEVVQEEGRQTALPLSSITSTQGSVLVPRLFLLHINDLLSSITNPIHSFADDSTLHAGVMSSRPISVVELERRRLATAVSVSKDLEAITAWGLKNMALPRSHSFKLSRVTENMIWHEHIPSIAIAAGKKLGYLFRARKYFPPSNLLTLYKAQTRPSLEYCSHIWGAAAPTTLSILDAVQRRATRLIGDPA
nr:unnamed protein product [Callosobruchus chinensis]